MVDSLGLTPCQARQKLATGLLGEFVPQCKSDGSYEQVQFHEGYYWCVDKDGKEVNGTRKHLQKPTCGVQALKSGKLLSLELHSWAILCYSDWHGGLLIRPQLLENWITFPLRARSPSIFPTLFHLLFSAPLPYSSHLSPLSECLEQTKPTYSV